MYFGDKYWTHRHWLILVMLTILVFVMAFPYHASYNSDKRCPAGLGMSLEWKCLPQQCVQNDRTVVYSLNCDGAHLLSSSSQRANQKRGIKLKKREHLCFWDGEPHCQGQGYNNVGFQLVCKWMFLKTNSKSLVGGSPPNTMLALCMLARTKC